MSDGNGSRPLRSIYLYITSGCNLRCRHCWIGAGPKERARRPELDFDTWKGILDQAIEIGLKSVKFTGGEPLLIRDTTYKLMCHLREREVRVNMETNGTLLDGEVADFFAETKGSFISVSLDGPDEEMHDHFRCLPGSFDMAVRGMELLAERKVRFQLICAIHRGNRHCVEKMVELGKDRKAGSVRFLPVSRMGRGEEMVKRDETLSLEETIEFCHFIQEDLLPRAGITISIDLVPSFSSMSYLKRHHRWGSCGLPNMCGFLADGTMALCGIAEHHKDTIYGAATDTPVKEIWESAPSLLAQRQLLEEDGMKGICSICAFRGMCKGHCRAASVDAFGEVNAPYPFCQAAYDKGLFPEKRIAGDRTKADTWIGKQKVHGWA